MPEIHIRPAVEADLPRIIELISGGTAPGAVPDEDPGPPLPASYVTAFREIKASSDGDVFVAEFEGEVVGCFQFFAAPHLANRGRRRAQVESVHVAARMRSKGIGEAMMRFAIEEARRRGCFRLQLTSNKSRTDAHRFYRRLGFAQSHEGFKLDL
ncbi:MAG: N-acetyltransferase family protein [Dehalococcoidia bacterium]